MKLEILLYNHVNFCLASTDTIWTSRNSKNKIIVNLETIEVQINIKYKLQNIMYDILHLIISKKIDELKQRIIQ